MKTILKNCLTSLLLPAAARRRRDRLSFPALKLVLLLCLTGALTGTALAETYTATTMRLLQYEGTVEIEDASGNPRFVMENARFDSGEALRTGEASRASVGLEENRVVTLDEKTRVEFVKQGGRMALTLTEGSLLMDVQDKLTDSETLEIRTSTMAVGIRGTIVYVNETPADVPIEGAAGQTEGNNDGSAGSAVQGAATAANTTAGTTTVIALLEGQSELTYTDDNGVSHTLALQAGQMATLHDDNVNELVDTPPVVMDFTETDAAGFVRDQLEKDPQLKKRVDDAGGVKPAQPYSKDGDWKWDGQIRLVAQSASKLYDGTPLTRPSDVLVTGLPEGFSIRVNANGSRTDAGTGPNPIGSYVIFNAAGEDVTSHFTNIKTESGKLTVDPAPLTAWTSSDTKVYDGTPLTSKEAAIHFYPGHEKGEAPWRNTSYVIKGTAAAIPDSVFSGSAGSGSDSTNKGGSSAGRPGGSNQNSSAGSGSGSAAGTSSEGAAPGAFADPNTEILYGICGSVWVHGTNPLTEETREVELRAGEKLTVHLHDEDSKEGALQTIEFKIEKITEAEVPDEILRLYGDNPDLMAQACIDAAWDPVLLAERVEALQKRDEELEKDLPEAEKRTTVEQNGLQVDAETAGDLMRDCTNVRITIDTRITNYNGRALGEEEAHYTGVNVDDTIKIKATGSQTDVGESPNSYEIDWGRAKESNYVFQEDIGTLTVTPATVTVRTGSDSKTYDGRPLTKDEASLSGLVHGETASVKATGSITDAGSKSNTYSLKWGSAKESNYTVSEDLGTLTVKKDSVPITFTAETKSKTYDGKPLTGNSLVTITQAASLDSAGTFGAAGRPADRPAAGARTFVSESRGLGFSPASDTAGSSEDVDPKDPDEDEDPEDPDDPDGDEDPEDPDGDPEDPDGDEDLEDPDGDEDFEDPDGDDGFEDPYADEDFEDPDGDDTDGSSDDPASEGGSMGGAAPSVDSSAGTPKGSAAGTTTITGTFPKSAGLPSGYSWSAKFSGSIVNAGTSKYKISSFHILDEDGKDVTKNYSRIKTVEGTLTIRPAKATVTTGSASRAYDGTPLTSSEATLTGLVNNETATIRATGSITEPGTAENTYEIDWGETLSSNYTLTEELGTLEVTDSGAGLTFTAASAGKVYDGTPLTDGSVTLEGDLPDGFTWTADAEGSLTDVGTAANTVSSYKILNADGKDVTDNFTAVSTVAGTLEVTPAEATVSTGSAEKQYDGSALTGSEASISGLADADAGSVTVTATGTITEVGTADNTYSIGWGGAKSSNYTLTEDLGTLEVTANDTGLTFTAASASRAYDGTALSDDTVTLEGGLPDGCTFTARAEGSQTDVGTTINDVSAYAVLNADGVDVTAYFSNINIVNGMLEVTPAPAAVTTGSAEKQYDGTALTSAEASLSGLADADTGSVTVTAAGTITEPGSTENTYTIDWGGAKSSNYEVTEDLGTLEVTKNSTEITVTAASADKPYDGQPLSLEDLEEPYTVEGELPAHFFVDCEFEGSRTDVGKSAGRITSCRILNAQEEDVTEYFTNIKTVDGTLEVTKNSTEITVTAGSADKAYDGKALTEHSSTVEGELPADFFVDCEFEGSRTDVGKSTNKITSCRILNAQEEDVTEYFTNIKTVDGTLEVTKNNTKITFTSASAEKVYDGEPLSAPTVTVEGLPDGLTYESSAGGMTSYVGAGTYKNGFTDMTYTYEDEDGNVWSGWRYAAIYDSDGKDVTDYFTNINLVEGTLTIEKLKIGLDYGYWGHKMRYCGVKAAGSSTTFKPTYQNGEKKGEYPTANNWDFTADTGTGHFSIFTGDSFSVTWTRVGPDVREEPYDIEILETSFTNDSSEDMSGNYEVEAIEPYVQIIPCKGTITTGSADKVYDGTPLTNPTVELDGFLVSPKPTVTATGTITKAGQTENTYSIDWGTEKSSNYEVTEKLGTLTVEKQKLNIDLGSQSLPYNGKMRGGLKPDSIKYGNGGHEGESPTAVDATVEEAPVIAKFSLSTGDTISVEVSGGGPDAGTYTQECTYSFSPDNSANYDVEVTGTSLTITPAELTVTTGSAEKVFDGTALTSPTASITGPDGITVPSVTATGTITDAGSTTNTYSVDWDGSGLKSSNYSLKENLGTLKVEKLKLIIRMYWKDMGEYFLPWTEYVKFGNGEKEGIKLGPTEEQYILGDVDPDKEYIVFIKDGEQYIIYVDSDDQAIADFMTETGEYTTECTWRFEPDISASCEVTVDGETRTIEGIVIEDPGMGAIPMEEAGPENPAPESPDPDAEESSEEPKAGAVTDKPDKAELSESEKQGEKADKAAPEKTNKAENTETKKPSEKAENAEKADDPEEADPSDKTETAVKPEKEGSSDKADEADKPEMEDRSEKADEADKTEKEDRSEKADEADKTEKEDRSEKADVADKTEKEDRSDEADEADKPQKEDRSDEADEADKAEDAEKPEKEEKSDKAEDADKPEKEDKADKADETGKPEKEAKKEDTGNADEADKPQKEESKDAPDASVSSEKKDESVKEEAEDNGEKKPPKTKETKTEIESIPESSSKESEQKGENE